MAETTKKREASLEEALSHVEKNLVPVDSKRSICVDGGYKKNENRGAWARPGAHMGYSEVLLRIKQEKPELGLTVEDSFTLVKDFVESEGGKYGWHTDHHADPDPSHEDGHHHEKPIIGCGHCAKAIPNAEKYGVLPDDVKELIRLVREAEAQNPMDLVNLDREHAERGVLIVNGEEYTVNSWDVDGTGDQFFIYNATMDQKFIERFVKSLNEKGYAITPEEFTNASNAQIGVTLELLAAGLPQFSVNPNGEGKADVSFLGNVAAPAAK